MINSTGRDVFKIIKYTYPRGRKDVATKTVILAIREDETAYIFTMIRKDDGKYGLCYKGPPHPQKIDGWCPPSNTEVEEIEFYGYE